MTASKYWGEERHKDAVYAVYLRKVRYVQSSGFNGTPQQKRIDPDDSISFESSGSDKLQWETIREKVIKAGTLRRIVESLVDLDGQMDSRHLNVFFATFRAFASVNQVFQALVDWYDSLLPANGLIQMADNNKSSTPYQQNIRSVIISILTCWQDMYPEDFFDSRSMEKQHANTSPANLLVEKMIKFAEIECLTELLRKTIKLRERMKRIAEEGGLTSQIPSIARVSFGITGYDPNEPCTSSSVGAEQGLEADERYARMLADAQARAQMFDIGRENIPQIAEQLTYWDAQLFNELKPYQCQGAIWGRRNKIDPDSVYSVRATIDQFNALCQRVMTSILLPECQTNFRALIIEKWIYIAKELHALRNYSALKAVLSSLQSEPVHRMKNIWAAVSKSVKVQLKELVAILDTNEESQISLTDNSLSKKNNLSFEGSFRRTKSELNFVVETQGTVPFLGLFLTELAMVDQKFSDVTEEGLINFEKRRHEFEVMAKLRLFQSAARAYSIRQDPAFCVWFYFLPALDEKECFARSLEIENEPSVNLENSTPDTKRKLRDGVNQFSKINSLSRLFGGLGYSSNRELDSSLGSSSLSGIGNRTLDANDKRTSFGNRNEELPFGLAPKSFSEERPPRGPRSRSQGARKENKCKSNAANNSPNYFTQKYLAPGSQFSPQLHFPQSNSKNSISLDCADSTSNGCTLFPAKFPQLSPEMPSSSRFGHWLPSQTASKMGRDVNTMAVKGLPFSRRFQTSTSSSSSSTRSSLGTSNTQKWIGDASPSSLSVSNFPREEQNFHLLRVGLDDSLQKEVNSTTSTNYKCIKLVSGDKMPQLIKRALEKHLLEPYDFPNYTLVQLLPDGGEFEFPDSCNPFYAVAPDSDSPMLNFILRKRTAQAHQGGANSNNSAAHSVVVQTKRCNKEKRNNLLRWSSGYLN